MIRFLLSLFCIAILPFASVAAGTNAVGWVERIHLDDINASFPAKLDTGAKTSSIDAEIMKLIEPKVKEYGKHGYAIFSVKDDNGKPYILKRKIKRWVRIKKKALTAGFVRRPVVLMSFCIGDKLVEEEVNLADRGNFIYPVLVGRNMLAKTGLSVNARDTYTTKPACETEQH